MHSFYGPVEVLVAESAAAPHAAAGLVGAATRRPPPATPWSPCSVPWKEFQPIRLVGRKPPENVSTAVPARHSDVLRAGGEARLGGLPASGPCGLSPLRDAGVPDRFASGIERACDPLDRVHRHAEPRGDSPHSA